MAIAVGMLALGIGVVGYWHRKADARREMAGRAVPSSFLGKVSLWLLLAGLLVGPLSRIEGPVAVNFFEGFAPLGLVAFALAIVAYVHNRDRGLLLLVPVVVGIVLIATPIAFFIAGDSG